MIVVIPSCRSINVKYLTPLINCGAKFVVVDDSEGSIKIDHPQFEVYNWSDRRTILGGLDVGIPRRNGACRDFGFYIAWSSSTDDDEIIIALDDDCVVEEADFARQVRQRLDNEMRPIASGRGQHFNVLDLYSNLDTSNLFPRGFPYSQRGDYQPWSFDTQTSGSVLFNLGLWRGVFDINAIDKIWLNRWSFPEADLYYESVVVPNGALISACSMNMQFRRALIPAVYQLPMHVEVMPGWPIDRYGDIWGGFILKTLMDIRGDKMSAGGPMIRHVKEDAYQRNIWQEHICHMVNDEFIRLLDRARENLKPASYLEMMAHLRAEFAEYSHESSPLLKPYLRHLDTALGAWITALERA